MASLLAVACGTGDDLSVILKDINRADVIPTNEKNT
jgi:hypothetical protein